MFKVSANVGGVNMVLSVKDGPNGRKLCDILRTLPECTGYKVYHKDKELEHWDDSSRDAVPVTLTYNGQPVNVTMTAATISLLKFVFTVADMFQELPELDIKETSEDTIAEMNSKLMNPEVFKNGVFEV